MAFAVCSTNDSSTIKFRGYAPKKRISSKHTLFNLTGLSPDVPS